MKNVGPMLIADGLECKHDEEKYTDVEFATLAECTMVSNVIARKIFFLIFVVILL